MWQVQVHTIAVWGWYLPVIYGLFQGLHKEFSVIDDILFTGFNDLGKDHDPTFDKLLKYAERPTCSVTKTNASSGIPASPILEKSYCRMVYAQILEKCRH